MTAVAGFVPFTSIDYPEHLAAVVFFKGCPLRCPFCHNPALQVADNQGTTTWESVIEFLNNRRGRLDGVVLSGGEPLMQPEILQYIQQIKQLGFLVAIHTSGVYPEKLKEVLPFTDWVGLDIKAPWEKYDVLCGRPNMASKVQESLKILLDCGLSFETRTTCDPRFLVPQDIVQIGLELKKLGVAQYALQKYRTFPEDANPPESSAINAFFTSEILDQVKSIYPNIITR